MKKLLGPVFWLMTENTLTSRQRKLTYAGVILGLLIPIVYLGAPTSEDRFARNKDGRVRWIACADASRA